MARCISPVRSSSPCVAAAGLVIGLALAATPAKVSAQRAWPLTFGVAVTRWDLGDQVESSELDLEVGVARALSDRLAVGLTLRQGLDFDHDVPEDVINCPGLLCEPDGFTDPGSSTALLSEVRYSTRPSRVSPYIVGGLGWRLFYGSGVRGVADRGTARLGLGLDAPIDDRSALFIELGAERVFGAATLDGWIFGLSAGLRLP